MDDHWGFALEDGRGVEIVPADEDLIRVTGADLARLAWHIGNRHTPCQVASDSLTIRADPVMQAMLAGLGATLTPARGPFAPEGGAYGTGRTMGHAHGPEAIGGHDHGNGIAHFHPPKAR
jgi:urease accessory protein